MQIHCHVCQKKITASNLLVTPNFTMKIGVTLGKSRTSADSSWVSPGMDHLLINISTLKGSPKHVKMIHKLSMYNEEDNSGEIVMTVKTVTTMTKVTTVTTVPTMMT